ncbi:hypothetical protein SAMN04488109_2104 [Chryseolinea serpens]|uniref:Uncharacterized protein n=1 Tax=Chryseolinea serpens TaxID=947013 RepID=A0A1M5N4M8_9BACT|nr:hypothetical protein SAMN04488109_2104 [Chryseolinea serpens]
MDVGIFLRSPKPGAQNSFSIASPVKHTLANTLWSPWTKPSAV